MRLHKVLAQAGIGSRRTIETWIKAGKIHINGTLATLGQPVCAQDKVTVQGKLISLDNAYEQTTQVLMYHKDEGEICSRQSEIGKRTVFANLPPLKTGRWVMVGRLDVNTSGLLLFTNNGKLAHQLMHPRFQIVRQYAVRVIGNVTENMLANLKKGVRIPEVGLCKFQDITTRNAPSGKNQWFTVTLSEGKYREVRQLWASQNCTVSRLIRIQYGKISLPRDLKKGHWRKLSEAQVQSLNSA